MTPRVIAAIGLNRRPLDSRQLPSDRPLTRECALAGSRKHRVPHPRWPIRVGWSRFRSMLDCATVFGAWEDSSGKSRSRPSDRTGVCRENRGAPSAPGLVSGSGFRSPNRPDKGRNPTYRAGSRASCDCDTLRATIVGNWREPSGKSRLNGGKSGKMAFQARAGYQNHAIGCLRGITVPSVVKMVWSPQTGGHLGNVG